MAPAITERGSGHLQYRRLGNSGLQVSAIGLGTNTIGRTADEAASIAIVQSALDEGVNYLVTADTYGDGASESFIGKAIQGRRQEVVIGTKCGIRVGPGPNDGGLSRAHIMASAEASLKC